MYVCICNPFTECDVEYHLESMSCAAKVGDVYAACSGGESMNCGTCSCALKKMVDDHNGRLAVQHLAQGLQKTVQAPKEMA